MVATPFIKFIYFSMFS